MKKQMMFAAMVVCCALAQPVLAEPVVTAGQLASAIKAGKATRLMIEFEAGTTHLTRASWEQAQELAELLKGNPRLKIQLAFRGGELSQQRAKSLQQELVANGVRDARVVAKASSPQPSTVAFNEYYVFRQ